MPIHIYEIIVPMLPDNEKEKELAKPINSDFDAEDEFCSLCKEKLELLRANDYNPKPHRLDICLNNIIDAGAIRPVLGDLK